jgi:hypothetical protein
MKGDKLFRKRKREVGRKIEMKEQQKTRNCKWYLKRQGKVVFKRSHWRPFHAVSA